MTILTAVPPDPTGYGRVIRKPLQAGLTLRPLWSRRICLPSSSGEREINSGIYCFETTKLFAHLDRLSEHRTRMASST